MERIQKIIANSGYCSRRSAEKLIEEGRVLVNGNPCKLGDKASEKDIITIDGKQINNEEKKVYYLLNKPRGVICSSKDEAGRKTVIELIDSDERIYPVGRLDFDTTGILLLTNDGDFANYLTKAKNKVVKTYLAKIEGILDKNAIDGLKKGVIVDDRKVDILDFKIKKKDIQKNTTFVSISIIEGRNHIVKNLFKVLGYSVEKLTRTGYGSLGLGNLKSGEYRTLTIKEIKRLYSK